MTINVHNFCCTKQQAEELKEAGIIQISVFYWYISGAGSEEKPGIIYIISDVEIEPEMPSAFTVAELGAMLLKQSDKCFYHNPSSTWSHHNVGWSSYNGRAELFSTQAECYGDRLLYLISNKIFTAELLNQRLIFFYGHKREM